MSLKFLDFGKPNNPFGEIIGKRGKLAWPVHAYRVTLPKPDNSGGLNMFERVILKIIDACGIRDTKALAKEICIPDDENNELVNFVLLRLRDKGFIDENNEILNQARDIWMKEKEPEFITALAFRELATGEILPFLHLLENENSLRKKEEKEKKFKKLQADDSHRENEIKKMDVIKALWAMKKRSNFSGNTIPKIGQIKIVQKPELYYLDCPIAIQKSDGEFRIADPFPSDNEFSLILESSFLRLLEQDENKEWLMNWKRRLSNPNPNKQTETPKEPFDNDKNWERYRKLVSNLRLLPNAQYRNILQIHSALEWALFYVCIQRQYDAEVRRLEIITDKECSGLLKEAAEKIGLEPPKNGFYPVKKGKLDDFLEGKADMATVISITLLMAEKDPSHPLHGIVKKYPDFIIRLFSIKKKRDDRRHGKGKAKKNTDELPEDAFMREVITALLPDIRFADTHAAASNKDSDADIMLDSLTNIQNEFGFTYYNRLGTDLQSRLKYAEQYCLYNKNGKDAQHFVGDLYAALEVMFRKILTGKLSPDINNSEFIENAKKRAKNAGLGEMPESSLHNVRQDRIRLTLQGDDQTLGACVIAFLLVSNEDSLQKVSESQPSFISDVAEVIKLSEHGNEPLDLEKAEIMKLRNLVYKTIKTLLEAEEWDYFQN